VTYENSNDCNENTLTRTIVLIYLHCRYIYAFQNIRNSSK